VETTLAVALRPSNRPFHRGRVPEQAANPDGPGVLSGLGAATRPTRDSRVRAGGSPAPATLRRLTH